MSHKHYVISEESPDSAPGYPRAFCIPVSFATIQSGSILCMYTHFVRYCSCQRALAR